MQKKLQNLAHKIGIDSQSLIWACLAVGFTYSAGTVAAENYLKANGFSITNDNNLAFVYTVQRSILPWVAVGNGLLSLAASASKKPSKKTVIKYLQSAYSQGEIGFAAYDAALTEVNRDE